MPERLARRSGVNRNSPNRGNFRLATCGKAPLNSSYVALRTAGATGRLSGRQVFAVRERVRLLTSHAAGIAAPANRRTAPAIVPNSAAWVAASSR